MTEKAWDLQVTHQQSLNLLGDYEMKRNTESAVLNFSAVIDFTFFSRGRTRKRSREERG